MKKSVIATLVTMALASWGVQAAETDLGNESYKNNAVSKDSSSVVVGGGLTAEQNSKMTMTGTKFHNNTVENTGTSAGAQGGGYYQMGGTLTASDIKVTGNKAKGTIVNGAGMALFNVNGSIDGARFTGNIGKITGETTAEYQTSEAYGGALAIQRWKSEDKLSFKVSNSHFSGNELTSVVEDMSTYGAAIYLEGGLKDTDLTMDVTLEGITAEENTAGKGGAIGAYDANIKMSGSTIKENTATDGEGGAIFVETFWSNKNSVSITDSSFTGNVARGDDGLARGGGLMVKVKDGSKSVDLTVDGSTFTGNEAVNGWGGGAFLAQVKGIISKTVFKGNKATHGGAIYNSVMDPEGSETGLTVTDSTFTGNVATTGEGGAIRNGDNATLAFTGTNVFAGNTAQEKPNDIYSSGLVKVVSGETTLNGGIVSKGDNASVNISENAVLGLGGVSSINKLTGTNGTMKIVDAGADVTVGVNEAKSLTLAGTSEVNDALKGNVSALAKIVTFEKNTEDIALFMQEGMYEGETTGVLGADGTVKSVTTKTNTLMQSTLELASAAPLAMNRIMMSDLRKRMGDIRTDTNTNGAWARYEGGRLSSSNGLENDFNTIQVGGDTKFGDWRVGGAFNYTTGDADYARGDAEMDAYGLSAYGLWLGEQGQFVDIVARVSKADTDMKVDGFKTGSMDSMAYSLSGEFGWRFALNDMVYVEPQVEAAYTYVDADDLDIDTASYKFDSVNSFIGRAGFAAGLKCPDNFGDVYFHASALHEFSGDSEITGGNGSKYKMDGKDTWVEYGIGANFNINKATYVWADVQRTSGADLDEDWRANVGVRYSF